MLKKNNIFASGREQQQAFETLKDTLTSSPVLIFPDHSKEFILCTDASYIGLGGILMQERNGQTQPMAYASRICTTAVKNYLIAERETLAVIYCLKKRRDVILGYPVRIWTDHTTINICLNTRILEER